MDEYIDNSRVVLVAIAMMAQLVFWANVTAAVIGQIHEQVLAHGGVLDLRGI